LLWFEFESGIFQFFYPIICSCGESRLLVSWCVGDRCDMVDSEKGHDRSRRSGAKDRRWSSMGRVLDRRTIERSSDVVCGLHSAQGDDEHELLG
jgi:hypothetical protein